MKRSRLFLIAHLCLWGTYELFAQPVYRTDKLKLVISFGNQVEMAFDNVERKRRIIFEETREQGLQNADFYFLEGKPNRAIGFYYRTLDELLPADPNDTKGKPLDIFKLSQMQDKRFTRAEKLLKRVQYANLDKDKTLMVAAILNSIGIYYHLNGNFVVAEKLYLKALEIRGLEAGKTSEYYVSSLHNLAVLRKDQGRYDAADDMLKYVIRFYEKTKSKTSYQYAVAVNNQAMLYATMGRVKEAMALLNSNILEASPAIDFRVNSLDKARIITNQALIHMEMGNYGAALKGLNEALKIYQADEAIKHPNYGQIKLYQAQIHLLQGNLVFLKEFIDTALEEIASDQGTDNMAYANALEIKAEYLFLTKDYSNALALYQTIGAIRASRLGVLHKDYLRVSIKSATCEWLRGDPTSAFLHYQTVVGLYLQVVDKYFYSMSEKEKTLFWNDLKPQIDVFYSFVLHQNQTISQALPFAYDLRLKTKGLLLYNANKIRNAIYAQDNAELTKFYNEWLATKELLASYYSMDKETIETMEIDVAGMEVDVNEMEKNINRLVSGNASISGMERATHESVAAALGEDDVAVEIIRIKNSYGARIASDQYCALVLTRDRGIQLVTIGDAQELETKWTVFYKNAVLTKTPETKTYKYFWLPLESTLGENKHVYLSPEGVYNLINVNSLRSEVGGYVIDDFLIEVVPNTGVIAHKSSSSQNDPVVLIGNPAFGSSEITSLPGTAREITAIQQLMDNLETVVMTEAAANEKSLKEVSKPKVLHIATHGFFMSDVNESTNTLSRTLRSPNPLMRSGLLLAGAGNDRVEFTNETSDGIFTAYEAKNMNLSNTDLVVLSACETGKGEVINGEGVYGLSRAFTIAGARNLIMSLWKVDDQATQQLMTFFYEEWLNTGDLKLAFVSAQKKLKMEYKDPYYWAAFVLVSAQ